MSGARPAGVERSTAQAVWCSLKPGGAQMVIGLGQTSAYGHAYTGAGEVDARPGGDFARLGIVSGVIGTI